MKIKRFLPICFLLSWMILILVGCERPTQDLSLEKIKADLVGVQVAGLEDGSFTITDPGYVELGEIRYDGRLGDAEITVKALNVTERAGIEGTLKLSYEFKSGQWGLSKVVAQDAKPLPAASRKPLTISKSG